MHTSIHKGNIFPLMLTTQVGPTGCVAGIEHFKELVDQSVKNLQRDSIDISESSSELVPIEPTPARLCMNNHMIR